MLERRRHPRSRSLLGAIIAFNDRFSSMNCVVRNLSPEGARIVLDGTATIPAEFDLTITRGGKSYRARMVWRTDGAAGVRFCDAAASGVIPLEWARRLRASERTNEDLRRRIAQLGG